MAESRRSSVESLTSRQVAFGEYRFNPGTGELWRGDKELRLTPRAAALLAVLADHALHVVTKQELIAQVWDGRVVGDDALTSCVQELRRALGDDPRQPRLIETRHRRGYRLLVPVSTAEPPERGASANRPVPSLLLPDKPSIAVLPFQNMSGDNDQEYFADGIVEEITTALSRFRSLLVIARNSSFTYKGRPVDVKQVGRQLGVGYVLEGSVRKAASQLRVTAQLVDALTGTHIWADRFDGALDNVFDLQDQVTEKVVAAIAPNVERAEIARVKRKPSSNLDAYDCYLRGIAWRAPTAGNNERALEMFYRAIELDPEFAAAYGAAAYCYVARKSLGRRACTVEEMTEVGRLARAAASLGADDAQTLSYAADALAYVLCDIRSAKVVIDQALALNSNFAAGWVFSGWINLWLGNPVVAIEHLERAMRLNPLDIQARIAMRCAMAHSYFYLDGYDEALSWANKVMQELPESHSALRIAAASAALAGQDDVAQQMGARLQEVDPSFRVSGLKSVLGPYQKSEFLNKYAEALRKAGLPH